MAPSQRLTALDAFLAAYPSLGDDVVRRIWTRVHAAGFSADDPAAFLPAFEAILEQRQAAFLEALRAEHAAIFAALKAEREAWSRTGGGKMQAALVECTINAALPKVLNAVRWRCFGQVLGAISLAILVAATGGYFAGREKTVVVDGEFAVMASRPDVETWLSLMKMNSNIDVQVDRDCRASGPGYFEVEGDPACRLHVWLPTTDRPAPLANAGVRRHVLAALNSMLARPLFICVFLGALFGGILFGRWLGPSKDQ